jgi:hypothetical protein
MAARFEQGRLAPFGDFVAQSMPIAVLPRRGAERC